MKNFSILKNHRQAKRTLFLNQTQVSPKIMDLINTKGWLHKYGSTILHCHGLIRAEHRVEMIGVCATGPYTHKSIGKSPIFL